jgi:hypothetical protein
MSPHAAVLRNGAELVSVARDRLFRAFESGIAYEHPANEALIVLESMLAMDERDLGAAARLLEIATTILLELPMGAPHQAFQDLFRERGAALQAECRRRENESR